MDTKYSKEILLHSLPDYISDKIEDKELKDEIEKEIQINPDFKNEYNEISSTLSFLNITEFESPQETYFNNLSVKINERISSAEIHKSVFEKFGFIRKILFPAALIIIVTVFIFTLIKKDEQEIISTISEPKNNESVEKSNLNQNNVTLIPSKENQTNVKDEKMIKPVRKHKNTARKHISLTDKVDEKMATEGIIETSENIDISDEDDETLSSFMADNLDSEVADQDAEEDFLYMIDDEENYEEELLDFSPEEQKEILENLNKSQI